MILNLTDYITKMAAIFDDTSKFLKINCDLSFDDTYKLEIKLQKWFLESFKKKFLLRSLSSFVHLVHEDQECMDYPKFINLVFLCDLFCLCQSVQHSLAKWLIQLLNPVLAFYSGFCVDNSFTFSSIIHQLSPCVDSQFMVSFDFCFTDEVISICANFLYHRPLTSMPSFPGSVFVLMELATKSVSFSFNDTMYYQVGGISMCSPLGPYSC